MPLHPEALLCRRQMEVCLKRFSVNWNYVIDYSSRDGKSNANRAETVNRMLSEATQNLNQAIQHFKLLLGSAAVSHSDIKWVWEHGLKPTFQTVLGSKAKIVVQEENKAKFDELVSLCSARLNFRIRQLE